MSDDGLFSDCFDEPNMEIQIKTLMGTAFDIKIAPTERVVDIKKKIYRVEGIPIHQQNLIFRSQELKDTNRLSDAGICNGSTLTLITSMRGGPISTRRLSVACEHQVVLKELKELLENTRDEIGDKLMPGSKVSVLVFKEGDIINLLRVIENKDGSYSPYSEKPISPPWKPNRQGTAALRSNLYDRIVEDETISNKIQSLRKTMQEVSLRRHNRNRKVDFARGGAEDEEEEAGTEKAEVNVKEDEAKIFGEQNPLNFKFLTDYADGLKIFQNVEGSEEIALKDKHRSARFTENKQQNFKKIASRADDDVQSLLTGRNRLHLTRLVLNGSERPKSEADSLEVEENGGWEQHAATATTASCKVGVLKERRQSLCFDEPKNYAEFGNCYHQTMPSAIPPQYAPKEHYFNVRRSPLYGRKAVKSKESDDDENVDHLYGYYNLGCNNGDNDLLVTSNVKSSSATASSSNASSNNNNNNSLLAPVIEKKRLRCNECNRRLNITNMYDCRCGLIFCAQHRYSEMHRCSYDYKSEGKRVLQQQNPLVKAEKVNKI